MSRKIVVIGSFDTKAPEYKFVIDLIRDKGLEVITVNTGVLGSTDLFDIDIPADEVAKQGGSTIETIRGANDRGNAIKVMSAGANALIKNLFAKEKFAGIIGMGGTAGTNMVTAAMRALPIGLPKVCVSTVASGDVSPYLGISDIMMLPSLTDIAGINSFSRRFLSHAVGALAGMLETTEKSETVKPVITASMFGNTTPCINHCRDLLDKDGFEVLVFHATGMGGKIMEKIIEEGSVRGALDLTTTEWADTLCGGVFDAGVERLDAPGKAGIPHLIAPGCLDMVNFGNPKTIPSKYKDRLFYQWNPNVVLMRTTVEENERLGEIFARKANAAKGRVAFIVPLKGFSILDSISNTGEPQIFWDPTADKAFIDSLKRNIKPGIEITELAVNINDPVFAETAVEKLLKMMQ